MNIPTFQIEIETIADRLRVRLKQAPDQPKSSAKMLTEHPLKKRYTSTVDLGQALYTSLFGEQGSNIIGQRFKHYYHSQCASNSEGTICVRLLLDFSSAEGQTESAVSLPWELLHDGTKWLARDPYISIARLTTTRRPSLQGTDASLRVLLTYAEPEHLTRFDGEAYIQGIAESLAEIAWLDLVMLPHATLKSLKNTLKQGFHVIHFVGHGEAQYADETGLDSYIYLESEKYHNKSERLSATMFREWIEDAELQPQLVVLAACQSGITDQFSVLGMAQSLLDTGVSSVVAMQAKLGIREAKMFAPAFYQSLASHCMVDDALQAGRRVLDNLWATDRHFGAEASIKHLLQVPEKYSKEHISEIDEEKTIISQRIPFPAWAVPILLLNGKGWVGVEPPPPVIFWKLSEHNLFIEMVYIPEGRFYIDKYPVTFAQYAAFAAQEGILWDKPVWSTGNLTEPAANMSSEQARYFAEWTGRRLPSAKEWQQAALSGVPDKQQHYPWGNEFRLFCNTRESQNMKPLSVEIEAEKYSRNSNLSGMCGIIGNIAEFVVDEDGEMKVCGGSYRDKGSQISLRYAYPVPSEATPRIGFRCIAGWLEIQAGQHIGRLPRLLKYSQEEQKQHGTQKNTNALK